MCRNTRDAKVGGRSRVRRLIITSVLVTFSATVLPRPAFPQSDSLVTVTEENGTYNVAATFTVPQAGAVAHAALTDYAQIPRFMPEVRTSNVLERDNNRAVVEQEAIARFMMFSKRVHLVLEVQEDEGAIRFRDRGGRSFVRYEGLWTIAERGGSTHVTYNLSANPSFEVPDFLLKRLFKRDASLMIERLKTEIEVRARQHSN